MNISFALKTEQIRAGTATVTRRLGWHHLKPGKVLWAIEKGQGLKKGEKIQRIRQIRVLNVRRERLDRMIREADYGREECRKEGFPALTPQQFVAMFCETHRVVDARRPGSVVITRQCDAHDEVTRIEYEFVDETPEVTR